MLVLGLNYGFHDPSVALVDDGTVISVLAEERISRNKHARGESPADAVRWCLDDAGVSARDVDAIATGMDLDLLLKNFRRSYDDNPTPHTEIRWALPEEFAELPELPPVHAVRHHLSHAASAFYCSGFDRAAVLVVDGMGETESTSLGIADENGIRFLESLPISKSLGEFYRSATQYAGLEKRGGFGAEGKLMGLAPYGVPDQEVPLRVGEDGVSVHPDIALDGVPMLNRFAAYREWFSRRNFPFMDGHEEPREVMAYSRFAASVQHALQEAILHLARRLRALTGLPNLVMAGGVALNCTANGVLVRAGIFDRHYFQPASADDGASLGAALEICARDRLAHGRSLARNEMRHAYWGPSYGDDACGAALADAGLSGRRFDQDGLVAAVADLLAAGRVVGWFQGRAELGPRALGARSILADPRHRAVVTRLNHVKGREVWRPLAPSVLAECFEEYFDGRFASPFMNVAVQVRDEVRSRIPAAVHVDGSARPQAVHREDSPLYWSLIEAFRRRTGVPVVLNTSFNLAIEPIVTTPEQAIASYLASDMDALALGPYVVEKNPAA